MKSEIIFSETFEIDSRTYTVYIRKEGRGLKSVWHSYVMNDIGIAKEMCGYPVDQRQAKEPRVYTPEDVMDLALYEAYDYISDLNRHEKLEDMLFEFMEEVDENRRIANEMHEAYLKETAANESVPN